MRHPHGQLLGVLGLLVVAGCGGGGTVAPTGPRLDVVTSDPGPATELPDIPNVGGPDATADTGRADAADQSGDTGSAPGGFGRLCSTNSDCTSGFCVPSRQGLVCTQPCIDNCPAGWSCRALGVPGQDPVLVCLQPTAQVCRPCMSNADCTGPEIGNPDARCISSGDQQGSFCGSPCMTDPDCPDGFTCAELADPKGAGFRQCRPSDGACTCSPLAIEEAAQTACGQGGECSGVRRCEASGLTSCSSPAPANEVCDGLDNDCNGVVDDGVAPEPCELINKVGVCTGLARCESTGGTGVTMMVCDAPAAVPEACDGADDDCDGTADNGFPDTDKDGVADCVDPDDDGDGIPDRADNCPLVANPKQTDTDKDGIGDACDEDQDGDGDPDSTDCAPEDPAVSHLATEECNGVDDNCDGRIDEGFSDTDGDGLGDCIDPDDDGDAVPDLTDNCPLTPNGNQADADKDGIGDACEDDTDGDGDPDTTDCAPRDPAIHRGAAELCNGADENCNGFIDEGFPDTDRDGVADCIDPDDDNDGIDDGADDCPNVADPEQLDFDKDGAGDACDTDDDGDGTLDVRDCAPLDAAVFPGATETCNGKDDDCDGQVDEAGAEGCEDFLLDSDGDGFGRDQRRCLCGPQVPFTVQVGGDCDDQNGQVFPGATEVCNGRDDDCDGALDEGAAVGCQDAFADGDRDGFGAGLSSCVCPGTPGFAPLGGDCDDTDATIHPAARERCDGADDDCDGQVDEAGAQGCQSLYKDGDADGFGVSGEVRCLCAAQGDFKTPVGGDCNDDDPDVFPTNQETCDGKDNNCNGQIDEGVQTTFFSDNDGDGFGGPVRRPACSAPSGFVDKAGDCNDFNPEIHPGAAEACNEIDDNCDGQTDEGLPLIEIFKDNDGDGFAAVNAAMQSRCDVPVGWTTTQDPNGDGTPDWDCDDSDVTVFPFAPTTCGDGKDNDCDGVVDRLCFSACQGSWPFQSQFPKPDINIRSADLNGDGNHAIVVGHSFGRAILRPDGTALHDFSAPSFNFARREPVFADIDDYDSFGAAVQTLEVLTADGSRPRFYKVKADEDVQTFSFPMEVYDASKLMVRDIDGDGRVEFFTSTWCRANAVEIFRFDRASGQIEHVTGVASPSGAGRGCEYTNGRTLTDLDGDGLPDLLFGSGSPHPDRTEYWDTGAGVYARRFTDLTTGATEPFCQDCFDTRIPDIFLASANSIQRIGGEIRAFARYFETNTPGVNNPSAGSRTWRFNLSGQALLGTPSNGDTLLAGNTDIDRDGTPETIAQAAWPGLFDVNGDGYPDRISTAGSSLVVELWDRARRAFKRNPGSDLIVSSDPLAGVGRIWDIDSDGRIEVLSSDTGGRVFCHELGPRTWNKLDNLPPYHRSSLRTMQWDNDEPNEGADMDGDGLPDRDRIVQVPSAMTARGDFYSYLTSATDVDDFLIDAGYGGNICVQAPSGHVYDIFVYSFFDKLDNTTGAPGADGVPDGLIWSNTGGSQRKCWGGGLLLPRRNAEFRFIISIRSHEGDFSPYWPYWIDAPK